MKEILSTYKLGDMSLLYLLDSENRTCGMCILPAYMPFDKEHDAKRRIRIYSLVQAKIVGDKYPGQYFGGRSMRDSDTTGGLKYESQTEKVTDGGQLCIVTRLRSEKGLAAEHFVEYAEGDEFVTVSVKLINDSGEAIKCEMISSFSLTNLSPYAQGAGENTMVLHRLRSRWSREARLVSERFEDLLLEDCWCYWNDNDIRFGQVGSMPVKDYFPFMAVEDTKNHVIWGVQMGCPSSWQMEIARGDDGISLCGGIADREFGHWMKTLKAGESFQTISSTISVCKGEIDDISARLVAAQEKNLKIPESEESLPVIFNEYCTTWGDPSHKNILSILNAIKGKGIDYFVVDCGWFRYDGVPWHVSMGEYQPSQALFPEGIKATVKAINDCGMRAGIWFEFENIGPACRIYDDEKYTKHMLKRDGLPLTTQNRRFWDMNDPWVVDYLDERVIRFMNENGFQYIKVDYNETIGIGCDNEDSLGEGLRQNMEGTVRFFERIREKVEDVVIENCASGGNRLEPVFMGLSSMASFSDAHECVEIPIIAADLHRAILPRQSQIWSVIRKSDDPKRISYSINAGVLGRLCLSGDVTDLSEEQWDTIDRGIAFYKKAVPYIKNGKSHIHRFTAGSDRHPAGYQALVRENTEGVLVTVHTFGGDIPEKLRFEGIIPKDLQIREIYSHCPVDAEVKGKDLIINSPDNFAGYSFIIK